MSSSHPFVFQYGRLASRVAVLAVQKRELEYLIEIAHDVVEHATPAGVVYSCKFKSADTGAEVEAVVALMMGVGRVEAALAATNLLQIAQPQWLFLVGIAGAFPGRGIRLGDVIVADSIIDYEHQRLTDDENEFRPVVYAGNRVLLDIARSVEHRWAISAPVKGEFRARMAIGAVASGDKVVASRGFVKQLLELRSGMLGVEMEGAGVAAAVSRIPGGPGLLMVRGVVDFADVNKRRDSALWLEYACEAAATLTVAIATKAPADNDS